MLLCLNMRSVSCSLKKNRLEKYRKIIDISITWQFSKKSHINYYYDVFPINN